MRGRDIGGIAVHAAARVMAKSQSSEVLVSRVVTDLVAGAGLTFSGRGSHDLKGLPAGGICLPLAHSVCRLLADSVENFSPQYANWRRPTRQRDRK
jgi:hypothetical protein